MGSLSIFRLKDRVESILHTRLILKKLLQLFTFPQVFVCDTEKLQGLVIGHKSSLYTKAFVRDFLSNFIEAVNFHLFSLLITTQLLVDVSQYFLPTLLMLSVTLCDRIAHLSRYLLNSRILLFLLFLWLCRCRVQLHRQSFLVFLIKIIWLWR